MGLPYSPQSWHRSGAFRPYERQGPGSSIDTVNGDVVRIEICHIGELSGQIDGYGARRQAGTDCAYRP
jgi:hypothetical protein